MHHVANWRQQRRIFSSNLDTDLAIN
uniref:Uncharacterized protein n=1 Tax=Arundo donax TaxID=35708 RepID=A0A0A8ZKI5_ARUDO